MRTSVIISLVLHAAILAYAIIGFASPRDFKPKPLKTIPVDIVTTAEFTKLTAGDKKAKTEKKEPAKQKDQPKKAEKKKKKRKAKAVHAPTKQEPEKLPVKPKPKDKKAKPEKKKIAKKKPKPKPKPKKKVEPPKPKPKTKTVKGKKKKFDSDDIAALLNKIPDSGAPDKPKSKPNKEKPKKKTKGQGGLDQRLAASIGAQVRRRIENECWTVPVGGRDVDNLVIKIRFKLDKGGNLQGQPKILNSMNGPAARAVSESAKRAIWQCQPYYEFTSRLPKNYEDWKEVTMNFDMRVMYGN